MNMNGNNTAVKVSALEKKFGKFIAVNRINFEVSKGEIFGFLGPNGAGKSTTIRMLCGIITPTSGSGSVRGFDIIKQQNSIKENIGYMSQKFSLYEDLTVEENINFYAGIYKVPKDKLSERKKWVQELANIKDLKNSLTKTLSGGWKQRLALGCAIIHQPDIIFLDEPTAGVDPISRQNFWSIIKGMAKEGKTVFVTTHYMDEAENCNRIALIYKGSIIASGTPHELKTKFMKEDVLQVFVEEPEEWIDKILKLDYVKEAALFGSLLHVVTGKPDAVKNSIGRILNRVNYSVKEIEPSLEDVFVSLIETYDEKAGK